MFFDRDLACESHRRDSHNIVAMAAVATATVDRMMALDFQLVVDTGRATTGAKQAWRPNTVPMEPADQASPEAGDPPPGLIPTGRTVAMAPHAPPGGQV